MLTDKNDYFSTLESAQRLDLIRHLIENSELVPLVRGPSGIGKSLLAARLQEIAPDNWLVCHIEADAHMSPDHLLIYIARCAGLVEIKDDPLDSLIMQFEALHSRGRLPVLLVDDVHKLPPTSLITLLRLYERQLAGEPLVSMVLFADEQIDMLLSTPQLRIMSPQAIQVIDLPIFSREDATAFMHYLLEVEGIPADLELDELRLSRIYRESEGVPGILRQNILAALADEDEPNRPVPKHFIQYLIYVAPVLLLVILIITFQEEINQLFQPAEGLPTQAPLGQRDQLIEITGRPETEKVVKSEPDSLSSQVMPIPTEVQPRLMSADSAEAPLNTDQTVSMADTSMVEDVSVQAPTLAKEPSAVGPQIAAMQSQQIELPELASEQVTETLAASLASKAPDSLEPESTSENVAELSPAVPETTNESVSVEQQVNLAVSGKIEAAEMQPEEEPVEEVETALTQPAGGQDTQPIYSTEWVLSRSADHYTIQILGVASLSAMQGFIEKHDLQDQVFYLQTQRKGKPWYSLLWGEFPDKQSAISGSKQLPKPIQKQGVWARSFGAIQATTFSVGR